MKIKKHIYDTFLLIICLASPITPNIFAKELVIFSFSLLLLRILIDGDFLIFTTEKIIVFLFLCPGIFFSILYSLNDLIRFLPVLLLTLGFPFRSFKIKPSTVAKVSACIIIYIFVTQILIAKGNVIILQFKDLFYPEAYAHKFFEGFSNSIFINIFELNQGHTPRHGGIYSNPNDMASIMFLYYLIFDVSSKYVTNQRFKHYLKKRISIFNLIIFILVIISLLLTKSRTILIALTVYLIIQNINLYDLLNFKNKLKSISCIFISGLLIMLNYEKVISGIFNPRQSFAIKIKIFMNYLNEAELLTLIFGGTFNVFFDSEYGYWLGSSGIIGLLAFIVLFYIMTSIHETKKFILVFLTISFGMTVFYSLMNVSLVIPLIILVSSLSYRTILKS